MAMAPEAPLPNLIKIDADRARAARKRIDPELETILFDRGVMDEVITVIVAMGVRDIMIFAALPMTRPGSDVG